MKGVNKYPAMLNLVAERKKRGLTQKALSEKVGVTHKQISAYECGSRFPRRDILGRLAKALDCEISDII